jgi:hypothetical protein
MKTFELAEAVAERIGVGLPAEEVWLFGSQARGDASPDSEHPRGRDPQQPGKVHREAGKAKLHRNVKEQEPR